MQRLNINKEREFLDRQLESEINAIFVKLISVFPRIKKLELNYTEENSIFMKIKIDTSSLSDLDIENQIERASRILNIIH